jgi:rubredoxin
MIECSMCGHSFTPEEGAACRSGCPVAGCGMVTCPSCAFEFPPASKLVTFVTNLVRRRPQTAQSAAPRSRTVGENRG